MALLNVDNWYGVRRALLPRKRREMPCISFGVIGQAQTGVIYPYPLLKNCCATYKGIFLDTEPRISVRRATFIKRLTHPAPEFQMSAMLSVCLSASVSDGRGCRVHEGGVASSEGAQMVPRNGLGCSVQRTGEYQPNFYPRRPVGRNERSTPAVVSAATHTCIKASFHKLHCAS